MARLKFTCILLHLTSFAFTQATFYVNQYASGQNNGSSWPDAFTRLQDAINIAQKGDEIWVAKGEYKPTEITDPFVNYLISFPLVSGVKMFGGFSGTESNVNERNWDTNITILSGDIGQAGYMLDNSKHVLTGIGLDSTTLLDGFNIVNGAAFDPMGYGGGLYLTIDEAHPTSQPTIKNCIFDNNFAFRGGAIATDPFMFNSGRIIPLIQNCTFKNNYALNGGGALRLIARTTPGETISIKECIFDNNFIAEPLGGEIPPASAGAINIYTSSGYNSSVEFSGCSFSNNQSTYFGGAINVSNDAQIDSLMLSFADCTFQNNLAPKGSVIYVESTSTSKTKHTCYNFQNCIFENNQETENEFTTANIILANRGNQDSSTCLLTMDHCNIINNDCSDCSQLQVRPGGTDLKVQIKNSVFANNTGGGVFSLQNSSSQSDNNYFIFDLSNALFFNNDGCLGLSNGLLNNSMVKSKITNSTFVNNHVNVFGQGHTLPGATTFPRHDSTSIENCIIWNPDIIPSRVFYNDELLGNPKNLYGYSIKNSLLYLDTTAAFQLPGAAFAFGEGLIINQLPEFQDTIAGNFRLLPCSPAVNAGNNSAAAGLLTDLDNSPRILLEKVDLGAYEQSDSCLSNATSSTVMSRLRVYPNPSYDGMLCVTSPDIADEFGTLRITDISGKLLFCQNTAVLHSSTVLNLQHLPAGHYMIQLKTNSSTYTGQWIFIKNE